MASIDGICEECGNTGLIGETCSFCGHNIKAIDADLDRFEHEDSVALPKLRTKHTINDLDDDPDLDVLEDADLEDDLDLEDGEVGADTASLDAMAEDEDKAEDRDGDLRRLNLAEDADEELGK